MCRELKHQKILRRGAPENAMDAHPVKQESLPSLGIVGVLDNRGRKVRLQFASAERTLIIASSESTQRMPYGAVSGLTCEPLDDDASRYIIKLETNSSNNYFFYFVPQQFVAAIKRELSFP